MSIKRERVCDICGKDLPRIKKKRNELKRKPQAQGLARLLDYLWTHEGVSRFSALAGQKCSP